MFGRIKRIIYGEKGATQGIVGMFIGIIIMVVLGANVVVPMLNNITTTAGLTGTNATIAGLMVQIFLVGMVVMICKFTGMID